MACTSYLLLLSGGIHIVPIVRKLLVHESLISDQGMEKIVTMSYVGSFGHLRSVQEEP